MTQQILLMRNLVINRGCRRVLKLEHFYLNSGELIAVVGPNGAGKSTLLQTISLMHGFYGEFELFGKNVCQADSSVLRRQFAMVFQETLLIEDTVFNNIAIGLKFRGLPGAEIEKRVWEVAVEFQCEYLLSRSASTLSGGEKQRVGIARAIVTSPRVLLLDEPFAALDLSVRQEFIVKIKQLVRENGITAVLVSHDFSEALCFADRAVVLVNGSIVQNDTPEKVFRHPANEKIARLVGMENMLPCSITYFGKASLVCLGSTVCFLYEGRADPMVSLCCFPGDSFRLWKDIMGQYGQWVRLTGVVTEVRPAYGAYQVFVKWAEHILRVRMPQYITISLVLGDSIQLAFQPSDVHLI